jgi:glycosyltransferase involved in cell wall biosynthesis
MGKRWGFAVAGERIQSVAMSTPTEPVSLSLIYLCWNEEASLQATLQEAATWCQAAEARAPGDPRALERTEILLVDDGSTDRSAEIVRAFAQDEPRVRLLQHGENRGMGAGLKTGISAATCSHFCMLAADGQIPPGEVDKLLPLLQQAPIVTSTYGNRPNDAIRTFISRSFRLYMRALVGVSFKLEGTYLFPVALARDEVGLQTIGADTFFFSFELITRAMQRGHQVAHGTIASRQRTDGSPSRVANLKRIQRVAAEVHAMRRRLKAKPR